MDTVLVTVIISVYNSEKYLEASIRSIMKQTYFNLEILIADDFSTDNSYKILEKLAEEDSRIRIIKNDENLKLAKTLNKLIRLAKGKYIARMDSDDIALKERIEKQVQFMEQNPDIDFCGTNAFFINDNNERIGHSILPSSFSECKYYFRFGNVFIHPSVLIKASVLKKELYSESFRYAQDYELWGRMLFRKQFAGCNINDKLLLYRICSTQATNTHKEEQIQLAASVLDLYEIMDKNEIALQKELFFYYNWGKITYRALNLNLSYIKKMPTKYSKVIYVKLLKISIRKKNIFMIIYCLLRYFF